MNGFVPKCKVSKGVRDGSVFASDLKRKEGIIMLTTDLLIAVLSFGLGCFSAGYMLGMNSKKHK